MSTHKNLITLCFAAVFTLGLAACGGGGGGGEPATSIEPTEPTTSMEPTEPTEPQAACDAGPSQACVDARQAELDAIEADDDATVGARNAAEMALATAQTALADANTAAAEEMTVSGLIDDAMTATDDIDDESTPVAVAAGRAAINAARESLDGMENLSDDATAALQGRIDALESSFSPNEVAVRMAAATAAAGTKVMAINAEAGETGEADAGLGGSTASALEEDAPRSYALSIERDRMATKVTVTVNGAAADDSDDVEFALAMDLGNGRTMHTRTMDADADGNVVEEVVIVSTDIDAPKATPFAMVMGQELDVSTDTMNDVPDPTSEAFAIDENDAEVRALVKSSAFTAGTVATLTFDDDDSATNDTDEAFETAGTYNGAMGTYRCNGDADCTVTLDAKGAITGMNDGWIFTPDAGATSDVADADYLHYGFWLMRTTDADGVLTYNEVETFAGSSIAASGSVAGVTGSATYEGGSTGVYVKSVTNPDGTEASATSGHFTADAMLTATFGQVNNDADPPVGTIAPSLLNTLTGTIDNFDLSGGEYNEWAVNLQGDIDTADGDASGTANGGGDPGSFNATFHGDVTEVGDVVPKPSSVVGEFDANFSNGTVAGGFGARKQ